MINFFSRLNRQLPDFLIIGAQKCGTTSLFHYLSQHPDIEMPETKEIHYFDLNYKKGTEWYKNNFPKKKLFGKKLTGEATPYYLFHPLVSQRVYKHLSKVKLIIMLRNPVDRAYSQFIHERKLGIEDLSSFEDAITLEYSRIDDDEKKLITGEIEHSNAFQHFSYISRGLYFKQISSWLKYFSLKKMYFVKSEDFFTNPEKELVDIYNFLGVRNFKPNDLTSQNTNHYQNISQKNKDVLLATFSEDNKKLVNLLGDKFSWI